MLMTLKLKSCQLTDSYGSREVPSYKTNFQTDLFFLKNRFIFFKSIYFFPMDFNF